MNIVLAAFLAGSLIPLGERPARAAEDAVVGVELSANAGASGEVTAIGSDNAPVDAASSSGAEGLAASSEVDRGADGDPSTYSELDTRGERDTHGDSDAVAASVPQIVEDGAASSDTAAVGKVTDIPETDTSVAESKTGGAASASPSSAAESSKNADSLNSSDAASSERESSGDKEASSDDNDAAKKSPAFKQSVSANDIEGAEDVEGAAGLKIIVSAPAGAFPEGAQLAVSLAPAAAQAQVEQAVEAVRDSGQNAAASLTFDIKVLDEAGNELQPADGHEVKVAFQMDAVASVNVDTQVYHMEEAEDALQAEELDVAAKGRTATVSTSGFSYYTVEFTYGNLQYVLPGDTSVPLAGILAAVGLEGSVEAVETSNPDLFSASNETGEWAITAHKAFKSEEWMSVTIAGLVYDVNLGYEVPATTTHNMRVTDATTATFKTGVEMRDAMTSLVGGTEASRTNVTAFKQASAAEWAAAGSPTANDVSSSGEPIYIWFDNGTIYWYSDADTVKLNASSSYMFQLFKNLADISGLTNLDTSEVTAMDRMFITCTALADISPLANWDTGSVTNMRFMFGHGTAGTTGPYMALSNLSPLANWDVSNVADMSCMFKGCMDLSGISPLANWNVSNVDTFEQMFNMNFPQLVPAKTSALTDVSALSGWKPKASANFSKMFQKISAPASHLEEHLFAAMPGTWTDPSLTSGTAGGGAFTPYAEKKITLTKTWDDDSDAYTTRPADGDALALKLGYTGTDTMPEYKNPSDVAIYDTEWTDNGDGTWTAELTIYTANELADYTLSETVPTGYTATGSGDLVTAAAGATAGTATMTNTLKTYDVDVTKTVTGDAADTSKRFNFTFTTNATSRTLTLSGDASGSITGGSGTFSLKGGQTATISGIPHGADYTVSEADYSSEQYITTSGGDVQVSAIDGNKSATFTNDRSKRTITVTKTWDDNSNATGARPTAGFGDVVLTTTGGTTTSHTTTAASWVGPGASANTWTYEFKIDPAEKATAITEGTVPTGYTCTTNTVSDQGWPAATGTADLTNKLKTYTLTVDKQVTGNMGDKTKAFNFTFTTNTPAGFALTYKKYDYTGAVADSGSIATGDTFALKHGERIVIAGIPHGATYSVVEDDYSGDGYTTTPSGGTIDGTMDADKSAIFTNDKRATVPTGVGVAGKVVQWQGWLFACVAGAALWAVGSLWRSRRIRKEAITSD